MNELDDLLNDLNTTVNLKAQGSNGATDTSKQSDDNELDSLLKDLEGDIQSQRNSKQMRDSNVLSYYQKDQSSLNTTSPVTKGRQSSIDGSAHQDLEHIIGSLQPNQKGADQFKLQNKSTLDSQPSSIHNSRPVSGFQPPFNANPSANVSVQQPQQFVPQNQQAQNVINVYPSQPQMGSSFNQMCADCQQPLAVTDIKVQALGQMFHEDHFRCASCKIPLNGKVFFEKNNRPWCEKCMNENFMLPKCAFCGEAIKGRCINALEKNWHPDHFFCSQCGKHFPPGEQFLEKDGKAYCEEDYFMMFAPKCATCDKPIMEEIVSALGKSFHNDCFVCSEPGCKISLTDSGSFYDYNGKPYCETHYHSAKGSLCASCSKPIVGRCLTAIGKKFHPEHFVCAFCKKQLTAGGGSTSTFKEKDGKPYCVNDYIKLFG